MIKQQAVFVMFLFVVTSELAIVGSFSIANAQNATLGPNNFTGTQAVNVERGDAIIGVTNDGGGKGVHGIGGIGGQFETGTGWILLGRGQGWDRFFVDSLGNTTTRGALRVDGAVSVGGAEPVAVDAPGIVGGRLQILPDGTVGIGTPTPSSVYKLDVAGDVNVRRRLDVAGDVNVGGSLSAGLQYVDSAIITVLPRSVGSVFAACPPGKKVIGGGFDIGGAGAYAARTLASTPGTNNPSRWIVRVSNEPGAFGGADIIVMATAVCASLR